MTPLSLVGSCDYQNENERTELARLIFLNDLHHLADMETDLRALLLLIVCDRYILIEEERVSSGGVTF